MTNFSGGLATARRRPQTRGIRRATLLLLCMTTGWPAVAADNLNATINIKLTVLAPLCKVTSPTDGEIEVSFGDNLNISKINGSNYQQPIAYKINCGKAETEGKNLKLTLKGTAASFDLDNSTLQTNINGLGIRVEQGGKPFKLNEALSVSSSKQPELTAVPVKDSTVTLKPGTFTAVATLLAEIE